MAVRTGYADTSLHYGRVPQWLYERMELLGSEIIEAIVLEFGTGEVLSRLSARIDNNAIQDGFQIYLHSFILTRDGEWAVVQQGMNTEKRVARRYHWHSTAVHSFVETPHTAIVGENQGIIMNLIDSGARGSRDAITEFSKEPPDRVMKEIRHITLPSRHDVRREDIDIERLRKVLSVSYEQGTKDFASLLLVKGLGPKTLRGLALVGEVIYGAPFRFTDPARFSFAHGGKDGHPFPVSLRRYDSTIRVLRDALNRAKIGRSEKLKAFRRLERHMGAG
jgi:hypothetical protein